MIAKHTYVNSRFELTVLKKIYMYICIYNTDLKETNQCQILKLWIALAPQNRRQNKKNKN